MNKIKDSANELCFIEPQKGNTTENRGNFDSFINFFETNFEYDNEGWAQTPRPPRREDILRGWNESRQQELDIYYKESVCNATTIDRVLELLELVNNRKMAILRVPNDLSTKNEHIQLCDALIAQLETTKQRLTRKEQDTPQPQQRKATETPSFKSLLLRGDDEKQQQIIERVHKLVEGKHIVPEDVSNIIQSLINEGYINAGAGSFPKLARAWIAEFEPNRKAKTLENGFRHHTIGTDAFRRKNEQDIRNYQEIIFE